jgi:hypothetical protein
VLLEAPAAHAVLSVELPENLRSNDHVARKVLQLLERASLALRATVRRRINEAREAGHAYSQTIPVPTKAGPSE